MSMVRRIFAGVIRVLLTVVAFLVSLFGKRDYLLFAGLGLLAYGLSFVFLPAAFIIPGAVMALIAIFGVR